MSAKSMARIVEIAEEFGNGEIFLTNRHVKVAFTGCSNDCAHVALNDFGIIGMTEPQYDPARCIGCGVCVVYCPHACVDAQSRALLPRKDHGSHRQAEPAPGAGLATLG